MTICDTLRDLNPNSRLISGLVILLMDDSPESALRSVIDAVCTATPISMACSRIRLEINGKAGWAHKAYVLPQLCRRGDFKKLRLLLAHEAPPATIGFVAARKGVFEDVLQETLLEAYRRGASSGPIVVHELIHPCRTAA